MQIQTKIFVECLATLNAGGKKGEWINITDVVMEDVFHAANAVSGTWIITDSENLGVDMEGFQPTKMLVERAALVQRYGQEFLRALASHPHPTALAMFA